MAVFDADAYVEALEQPEVTVGGRTYKGRLLSIEEFAPFADRMQTLHNSSNTDFQRFAQEFLYAVFPRPLWLLRWLPDPVPQLLKSPALVPTLTHLFTVVVQGISQQPMNQTSGTDSQQPVENVGS